MENQITINLIRELIFCKVSKLQTIRESKGLSIKQLSDLSGIDVSVVMRLEQGKTEVTDPNLQRLASILEVDVALLTDSSLCVSPYNWQFFNEIFRQYQQSRDMQMFKQQILNWMSIVLYEACQNWQENRQNSISVLYALEQKAKAVERGRLRDKKYAPFRTYFKTLQKQKFIEAQQSGKILKANRFVIWFLETCSNDVVIPYKKSNWYSKLTQLAQANNREFKQL